MKKVLILGAFVLFATVSIASGGKDLSTIGDADAGVQCPMGCNTAAPKCCTTKGGDTYYGKL